MCMPVVDPGFSKGGEGAYNYVRLLSLTLSTRMLYWTSWPENADAVAVQLNKMIITQREADSWLFTGLGSRIMHATSFNNYG